MMSFSPVWRKSSLAPGTLVGIAKEQQKQKAVLRDWCPSYLETIHYILKFAHLYLKLSLLMGWCLTRLCSKQAELLCANTICTDELSSCTSSYATRSTPRCQLCICICPLCTEFTPCISLKNHLILVNY